ncbi:MAG: S24 family peptidase [Campylobacterota bacterium]
MKEIEQILVRIRKAANVKTDVELCEKIDFLKYPTLDTWKNRNSIPFKKLHMIADRLGADYQFLLTGKSSGTMVSQSMVGNGNNQVNGSNNSISGISAQKEDVADYQEEDEMINIPYLHDVVASAGGGAVIPHDIENSFIKFSSAFLKDFLRVDRFGGIHVISATGNSMEPTIAAGELLMVNPYENEDCKIKDGAIYVIICSDSVFVKRIRTNPITKEMKLVSDNREVDDIIIKGDDFDGCKIIGRVVGHFDKL